jgi:hypothetical protein
MPLTRFDKTLFREHVSCKHNATPPTHSSNQPSHHYGVYTWLFDGRANMRYAGGKYHQTPLCLTTGGASCATGCMGSIQFPTYRRISVVNCCTTTRPPCHEPMETNLCQRPDVKIPDNDVITSQVPYSEDASSDGHIRAESTLTFSQPVPPKQAHITGFFKRMNRLATDSLVPRTASSRRNDPSAPSATNIEKHNIVFNNTTMGCPPQSGGRCAFAESLCAVAPEIDTSTPVKSVQILDTSPSAESCPSLKTAKEKAERKRLKQERERERGSA